MSKKVYDFELEQSIQWAIDTEKRCQALVPKNISSKRRDYFLNDAFLKIEKSKWCIGKMCEKCNQDEVPLGNKRFCGACVKKASRYTDEGLMYGGSMIEGLERENDYKCNKENN